MNKANASLYSILSIIAVMLLIAAAWQMLSIARNMYLGMIQGKTASFSNTCDAFGTSQTGKIRENGILRNIVAGFYLARYNLENASKRTDPNLNEKKAVEILDRYARAQEIYRLHYGKYAEKTSELIIENNGKFSIIDPDLKVLNWAFNRERAVDGYFYIETVKQKGQGGRGNFFLCAVPAKYDESGINTFCIDSRQIIFKKDNWGVPVFEREAVDDSWENLSQPADAIKERSKK